MEHISKTKKSFKVKIPAAFVRTIRLGSQTKINAIKKVIEQKIKASEKIVTNDGEFDVNLFTDWEKRWYTEYERPIFYYVKI